MAPERHDPRSEAHSLRIPLKGGGFCRWSQHTRFLR